VKREPAPSPQQSPCMQQAAEAHRQLEGDIHERIILTL
jgi:hypothetical protein